MDRPSLPSQCLAFGFTTYGQIEDLKLANVQQQLAEIDRCLAEINKVTGLGLTFARGLCFWAASVGGLGLVISAFSDVSRSPGASPSRNSMPSASSVIWTAANVDMLAALPRVCLSA